MGPNLVRNTDSTGFGDAFESGRDVDPVSEEVTALRNEDISNCDADSEEQLPFLRNGHVLRIVCALNVESAACCVDRAVELCENRIPCGVEDAAMVLAHLIGERDRSLLESMNRILFVLGNEPAVARHVRCQNDCQRSSHDLTGR